MNINKSKSLRIVNDVSQITAIISNIISSELLIIPWLKQQEERKAYYLHRNPKTAFSRRETQIFKRSMYGNELNSFVIPRTEQNLV